MLTGTIYVIPVRNPYSIKQFSQGRYRYVRSTLTWPLACLPVLQRRSSANTIAETTLRKDRYIGETSVCSDINLVCAPDHQLRIPDQPLGYSTSSVEVQTSPPELVIQSRSRTSRAQCHLYICPCNEISSTRCKNPGGLREVLAPKFAARLRVYILFTRTTSSTCFHQVQLMQRSHAPRCGSPARPGATRPTRDSYLAHSDR
jgi:hypothetical protein